MEEMIPEEVLIPATIRLLIVDDSRAIRAQFRDQFEKAGYQVDLAENGKVALEKIYHLRFDLVLLDVEMPGMDGIKVLSIIRRSFSKFDLPVIIATSRDAANEVARAFERGSNDYITKPVQPVVLQARIENQLLQKQAANYLKFAKKHLEKEVRQRTAQLEEANSQLNYRANYDLLTGLPNRAMAYSFLEQRVRDAHRNGEELGVIFIDLDHFKKVNDTLGHAAGDKLLKEVACRLTGCVREADTIARLGGDEFLLILAQGRTGKLDAAFVAARILERFSEPFSLDGQKVFVTASLGGAIYPDDGKGADTLMANADAAMYQSKSDGRHALSFFSKNLTRDADRRLQLEYQLRHALDRNEMSLLYQPIVRCNSGDVDKFEALLRWETPELGIVYPDEFIPIAESTGLIVPIGEWVLESVCEKLKYWREQGERNLRAAVNISAAQFRKGANLAAVVASVLDKNSLPPDSLELEITEGLCLHDTQETFDTLNVITAMGVRLSMDDFGTGYSALSYLRRFNFDVLKIDRSFIQDVLTNEKDSTLVNAIIAMAHGMGLEVVAEGVEEELHVCFLKERNCDYIQGYFFSRPLMDDAFSDFLNQRRAMSLESSVVSLLA